MDENQAGLSSRGVVYEVLITLNLSSEYTGYITEGNSPMMQLLI
jgi:hypothetical protein